jgi:sortase (surface protein transpeptidase)
MIQYEFRVTEQNDDSYDENFGYERLAKVPSVGDRIDLHWLDGSLAYPVTVTRVDGDRMRIWVKQ